MRASNRAESAFSEFGAFISEARVRRMADGFGTWKVWIGLLGNPRVNRADLMRSRRTMILAYAARPRCRPEGRRPSDRTPRGPQPCSSGSGGNGVRSVIVEDLPQGVARWHGNAASYLRNFDLALGILTRPAFCCSFNARPSSKLSESVLIFHGFPVTPSTLAMSSSDQICSVRSASYSRPPRSHGLTEIRPRSFAKESNCASVDRA